MRVEKNNIERKVFPLKDFRGVDYASSPLEVKPYRATDMANLLLRDGQLQKRYGFRQLFQEGAFYGYTFNERVGGVNAYRCGKNIIVAYADLLESGTFIRTYGKKSDGAFGYLNEEYVSAFLSGATGVYEGEYFYLFWRFGILRTKDGKTWQEVIPYAPTTTINVPLTQKSRNGLETIIKVDTNVTFAYQSNESLNMLTTSRKNNLLLKADVSYGEDEGFVETDEAHLYFKLDGQVKLPTKAPSKEEPTPKLAVMIKGVNEDTVLDTLELHYNTEDRKASYWEGNHFSITYETYMEDDEVKLSNAPSKLELKTDAVGTYLKTLKDKINSLNANDNGYVNEYGYVQLYIEFDADVPDESDKIYTASTAANFGVGGAEDRIFVANGNKIYISENTAQLKADASYFPVDQWIECGYSDSPITAMMRVSDGTLAIFKDVSAHEDVSVYYTSGYYESVGVGEEGNEYQRARFTVKAGDIRRTGISANTVANLEGDNIFTCKEGVYGIQLSDNVASGERYARERSRTINPKITQFDLHNARGIVYRDKYYLAVGNGEVYVADARYKFNLTGDQQNTFNYEWFRLTGLNVLEWFIYDDKLHFIDKDGYFCEFTDGFADQYLVTTDNHELTVNDDGTVTFNADRLPLVNASSYAIDNDGDVWEITLTKDKDGNDAIAIPGGIEIEDANDLDLWFCVPVTAYWQSAVMDLNSPMYLKNMWGLSMVASAKHGGKINLGYKTRMNAVSNVEVEGANAFAWGQAIDLFGGMQTSMLTGGEKSFGMYTFDVGGYVGINTYTRRIFDRNFAHIQLLFTSETTTDCAVAEMDIEYSIARRNIGVG